MKKLFALAGFILFLAMGFAPQNAWALPSWARRYNADCSMCHTMYPQLNAVGHKFRRLGYRMPDEFDSKETQLSTEDISKLTHYFSARGRPRMTYTKAAGTPAKFNFTMEDVTVFYAGPVTRNFSFYFELPFEPADEKGFLEVGQLNMAFGSSDSFFFARAGQFHSLSKVGFGGLDRFIGISAPAIVSTTVNGATLRQDVLGVELGFSRGQFTGLLQAHDGINPTGTTVLDNADSNNAKDLVALLEYMIPDNNGSISAVYMYGKEPTPEDNAGTAVVGAKETKINRAYLFADYTFDTIGLRPIIGGGVGFDNQFVRGIGTKTPVLVSATDSRSWFSFIELDKKINDNLYALGRFDMYDPTNKDEANKATDKTWSGTGGVVWQFQKFMRTTLEYQAKHNKDLKTSHAITGELQLVF